MKRIYIANNYFYIEDDATNVIEFRYPASRVYLFSNTGSLYTFKKIGKNEIIKEPIKYSNIKDSNGNVYTNEATFLDIIDKNTANTNLSNSGTLDVLIQDNDSPNLSLFVAQQLDVITVLTGIALNDEEIDVETTGATPIVGNFLELKEGSSLCQVEISTVTPIAGNQYTLGLSVPSDFAFTVAATVLLQNVNMNIDGSTTPVMFEVSPKNLNIFAFDITRISVNMTMSSAGDNGLFGNITKLTKGMYARIVDGSTQNLFNIKENGDFALESAGDVDYFPRSGGGGSFGLSSRITFNGADKQGVVKRLTASTNDSIQFTVRDAQQGVTKIRIKVQGHVAIE